jgi:DNA-binding transcriptional regulator YiaG
MTTRMETAPAAALIRIRRLVSSDRLGELREGLGLSQGDIARHLGVAPSQVSRWENGKQRPRPHHALALIELLDGASG